MKNITLFTGHYIKSKRKAGFHWLAEAFTQLGYHVTFVTCPISYISWVRNDYRFNYFSKNELKKKVSFEKNLDSYVLFTKWHPVNLRIKLLNTISNPFFSTYGNNVPETLKRIIINSDILVFESNHSLLLFDIAKSINPDVKTVYRVSDDVRLLNYHPIIPQTEDKIISQFDLISIPSKSMYQRFINHNNLKIHNHGIQKNLFDEEAINPYNKKSTNCIFVGTSDFDYEFLEIASDIFPNFNFHIIGPIPQKGIKKDNVIFYGEMPFNKTIPYVKYADIGLQTRSAKRDIAKTLTDSLKVIQYTYCKLPVIAPEIMKNTWRQNMFYYEFGNTNSIKQALEKAIIYDRSIINTSEILSWDEIAKELLDELN